MRTRGNVSGTSTAVADQAPDTEPASLAPADPEFVEHGGKGVAAKYGLAVAGARPSPWAYARRLWQARYFIVTWATARNQALYSGSRLGQIWQVLTPVFNVGVYYLIFGILLGTNRGVPDFIVYLVSGVFLFNFMQSAVLYGSRSISDNLVLIRALYFPRASLPIAVTIIQLQQLAIAMVILIGVALGKGEPVTWHWLMIVPALCLQAVFNTGLALVVGRFGAVLTDTSQLLPFVLRTWMYTSGVFYSIKGMLTTHHVPAVIAWILDHNPPLVYIQLVRNLLITPDIAAMTSPTVSRAKALTDVQNAMFTPGSPWLWAVIWAAVLGIGGYLYFWQGEETYGRG